jgi:REP element-mobilizing transposase RayT
MTIARKLQINLNDTVHYHCISRCVRRSFLFGYDSLTQRNFDHRRAWVITQLQSLCSVFAIKVCAYAVMSNHYHLVLCVEPDAIRNLSDEEVLMRIKHIHTLRMHGTFASIDKNKLNKIVTPDEMESYRKMLIDISTFMGALNEYLARKANKEDDCKGRFWESRFKSMSLLDDAALLTCMAYVDLNPFKSGMAVSLEEADFTSIQERIRNSQSIKTIKKDKSAINPGLKHHLGLFASPNVANPHIPCSWENYYQLVEWTQQQLQDKKSGSISIELQIMLDKLGVKPDVWLSQAKQLEKNYSWMVGSFEKLKHVLENKKLQWVRGMRKMDWPRKNRHSFLSINRS